MSKLTQARWDALLIRAWIKDKNLSWVLFEFFNDGNAEIKEMINRLKQLNIKRSSTGGYISLSKPVRAFFAENSRKLSDKFFDGEDPLSYIFNLDDYKWSPEFSIKRHAATKRVGSGQ